jgi:hypothetical protein
MTFRNRAHIGQLFEVLGFIGALAALSEVATDSYSGHSAVIPMIALIIAVLLGCFGVIYSGFNSARTLNDKDAGERLALETLARLSQPKKLKKPNKRLR